MQTEVIAISCLKIDYIFFVVAFTRGVVAETSSSKKKIPDVPQSEKISREISVVFSFTQRNETDKQYKFAICCSALLTRQK